MREGDLLLAGRYRLQAELGRGGMGVVWRAWDDEVGETVAVKLLPPLVREAALAQFRREVRLARRVTHRNVARTYDLGSDGGRWFLTMELVEGDSLRQLLRREERLEPEHACTLLGQVADGLAAAHEAGVLHRDLKPGNVLVEPGGRAVLTDFGIARSVALGEEDTGEIVGTPAYMAPEQVAGERIGPATDLYALGILLFEALTGRKPFRAGSPHAVAFARLREAAPDPRTLAEVPEPLAELISELLARDPAARPRSAADVARRLRRRPPPEPPPARHTRVRVDDLRWLGPPDGQWLAEAMTVELQHDLARTSGLEVVLDPSGDADAIVTGTVQRGQDRVRVAVRVEAPDHTVRWSSTLDAELTDVLVLQETLAGRVAEHLRVALAIGGRSPVPREVLERFLRVRARVRSATDFSALGDPAEVEALGAWPEVRRSALALAALVRASRYWVTDTDADTDRLATDAVQRALVEAPDEPDAHVAAALLASADARYPEAIAAIRRASEIAPGAARPINLLGLLLCETGRVEEGLAHLERAVKLDPDLHTAWMELGRQAALAGDPERCDRIHATLLHRPGLAAALFRVRYLAWRADRDVVARAAADLSSRADAVRNGRPSPMLVLALLAGEIGPDELVRRLEPLVTRLKPRYATYVHQIAAEATHHVGADDHAQRQLEQAADLALVDLVWLDRCPALERLRERPSFEEIRRKVRVRVARVWSDPP